MTDDVPAPYQGTAFRVLNSSDPVQSVDHCDLDSVRLDEALTQLIAMVPRPTGVHLHATLAVSSSYAGIARDALVSLSNESARIELVVLPGHWFRHPHAWALTDHKGQTVVSGL